MTIQRAKVTEQEYYADMSAGLLCCRQYGSPMKGQEPKSKTQDDVGHKHQAHVKQVLLSDYSTMNHHTNAL